MRSLVIAVAQVTGIEDLVVRATDGHGLGEPSVFAAWPVNALAGQHGIYMAHYGRTVHPVNPTGCPAGSENAGPCPLQDVDFVASVRPVAAVRG